MYKTNITDNLSMGLVPGRDDLIVLKKLDITTIIDLREEHEKLGGFMATMIQDYGFNYINIPINFYSVNPVYVKKFYKAVFENYNNKIYIFSRSGRKPIILLLLFDTMLREQSGEDLYSSVKEFSELYLGDAESGKVIHSLYTSDSIKKVSDHNTEY